jgi:multidrug efflux pump subunit AcrB
VRLADLGKVVDGAAEQRTFARLDGKPVVAFSIFRAKGASDADVAREVEKKIASCARTIPMSK